MDVEETEAGEVVVQAKLFGDIIKVTPSSKVVGDMALFMVQNDLTPEKVLAEGQTLDFPQSVVDFFAGDLGNRLVVSQKICNKSC